MGLYDNYRLANSTEIPRFVGSAGEEFVKVGQYKQGLYDTAIGQGADLNEGANELDTTLAPDKQLTDELRNTVQGKIRELSTKGDWENSLPELRTLGQQFANRSKEIMAPQQQAAAYKASLGEKDKNLTPEQQNALYAMSVAGYQGLTKNARGQYQGTFSGVTPAKNIDVNEKIDKWLKDTAIAKGGNEYEFTSDGDMWITKEGVKIERVSKDKLGAILQSAQKNDTEYQSFKNMQGKIAGFTGAQGIRSIDQIESPTMKQDTQSIMQAYGIPLQQAYGLVAERAKHAEIDNASATYGLNKYTLDNKWTTHDIKTNEFSLKDHLPETGAGGPYVFQGPDSKLTNDEKDYGKLQKTATDTRNNISLVQSEVGKLTKDLQGTLSPATRAQKQSDLTNAQNRLNSLQTQVNRAEDITNYSKMVTAQGMGYKDYEDFYEKNKGKLGKAIEKTYPNGIMTASGRLITKEELTEAAASDRIKADYIPLTTGNGVTNALRGSSVTLKDGTIVPITGIKGQDLYNNITHSLNTDSKNVAAFNSKLKDQHAANVKDFAIQSANIQVPENDRQELTTIMKGMKDGIRFSEPGQLQPVSAPDNFRVVSAGVTGTGSDAKLQIEELDKDGKTTGKYYDAVFPNSNVAERLARQYGASKSPEARQIADMLSHGSGARQLMSGIPGMTIKAGAVKSPASNEADPIQASIKIIRHLDKTISYELVDDSGNRLREPTDNVGEAGAWLDAIQQKQTYSNGQKLIIDKGRTKTP